jgi:hypothetical protein
LFLSAGFRVLLLLLVEKYRFVISYSSQAAAVAIPLFSFLSEKRGIIISRGCMSMCVYDGKNGKKVRKLEIRLEMRNLIPFCLFSIRCLHLQDKEPGY